MTEIADTSFDECKALTTIYVPAKKSDYYKQRLPEKLHSLIVELQPEEGKEEITQSEHIRII